MTGRLRVGEAVAELLVQHYGVDTVFGIPGVHNIELFRGLHRSGVRLVSPRHEQGAGFMADAWSVVTGRPGVCCVISGPGLTNTITPMAQAFHDSHPMLVLAATTASDALGKHIAPLHDLDDQALLARSVCAFSETVTDPAQVPELIARAWDVFTSARPRPVHLAFPTDVLRGEIDAYIPVPSRRSVPVATPQQIDEAALVLRSARTPVVVAGGGSLRAAAEIEQIADRLDAMVVLTGNAKGLLPSDHPRNADTCLWFPAAQQAVEAADAVVMVGTELGDADLDNGGRALSFTGPVVRIDIDPEQITRRVDPTVALVGDAAPTLAALLDALGPSETQASNGTDRCAALRATWRAASRADLVPWLEAIEGVLPADAIVALDSTQLAYAAHTWLPARRPRSWLAPYGFGTLGCALPMAVGAAIAAPDRPVVAIAGDGGWLFTVAEMAVAADLGLNVVLVLWDNRGYAQIHQSFVDVDAQPVGVDVSSADPVMIARGFGWSTDEVHRPDELASAVAAAIAAGGPHLVRVMVPSAHRPAAGEPLSGANP
jgi:acetolactate synthase-1/2/3 large subunit